MSLGKPDPSAWPCNPEAQVHRSYRNPCRWTCSTRRHPFRPWCRHPCSRRVCSGARQKCGALKQAKERFPSARDIVIETIAFKASQEHYNELEPGRAVWLAAVALIRHSLTEYDQLLLSGRGKEEARAQVSSEVNRCLQGWGWVKYIQTQPQKIGLRANRSRASSIRLHR